MNRYQTKYHSKKTYCNHGHVHDSKLEAMRCNELHLLQKAGQISGLEVQKEYILLNPQKYERMPNERKVSYIADFVYIENGMTIIEDTKGFKTPEYIIKRKFLKKMYCWDGTTIFREFQK